MFVRGEAAHYLRVYVVDRYWQLSRLGSNRSRGSTHHRGIGHNTPGGALALRRKLRVVWVASARFLCGVCGCLP